MNYNISFLGVVDTKLLEAWHQETFINESPICLLPHRIEYYYNHPYGKDVPLNELVWCMPVEFNKMVQGEDEY